MTKKRLKKMVLDKALERYFATISVHKRGKQQEFYRINAMRKTILAEKYMDEITSIDIAEYRDIRLASLSPRTGRKISGNTVRLEMALLSSLYNIARVEWGTCHSNPVEHVRKPPIPAGRTRRLLAGEESRLLSCLEDKNPQISAIFTLAIETAMRQGELLSLRWEHINLSQGVAHLPVTKNGSSRDVPLSAKARKTLGRFSGPVTGPVFSYTSNGFKSAWRKAVIETGIENLHFHDLRHEAISRLSELGTLNLIEMASISGHKSLTMLKRYTHLRAVNLVRKLDVRKRQAKKFAALFIPYPVDIIHQFGCVSLRFSDFDGLTVSAPTHDEALREASVTLLRMQVSAAQNGDRLPPPGPVAVNAENRILINPL
ncbi:integrase [Erwinia rhapontici]|nr:integrase [Erwinia rhapontici]